MKPFYIVICVVLLFFGMFTAVNAQQLIIENVTLMNPTNSHKIETRFHQWVEITDGRISKISATKIEARKNTKTIDAKGRFLIPGLMDSHVHTGYMPGMLWSDPSLLPMQQAYIKQEPRSYLYYGITQLLDPHKTNFSVQQFNQAPAKPDLFFCGATQIIGGYTMTDMTVKQAVESKRYFIYRAEIDDTKDLPDDFDPERYTPEAVVERMASDGAKCVKIFIEDGFGINSDWPMLNSQLIKRIRVAADKHGLLLMAHANAVDMQKIAVDESVDVIAHGMWNWLNSPDDRVHLPQAVRSVADRIIEKKLVYQPTLSVMRNLRDVSVANHLDKPGYIKVVSKQALAWYRSKQGQWFADELVQDWGDGNLDNFHRQQSRVLNNGERVLNYLYQKGHPIVLASDTPPAPTSPAQPGLSSYFEMQHMYRVGVQLPDLLIAATLNNAKAFGIEHDFGSIEQGKVANLLLLAKNPLETVEAYDSIEQVIIRGKAYPREYFKVH